MIVELVIKREMVALKNLIGLLDGLGIFFYKYFILGPFFKFYISVAPLELALISDFLALIGKVTAVEEEEDIEISFCVLIILNNKKRAHSVYALLESFGMEDLLLIGLEAEGVVAIRVKFLPFIVENSLILIPGVKVERR